MGQQTRDITVTVFALLFVAFLCIVALAPAPVSLTLATVAAGSWCVWLETPRNAP